MHIYGQTDRHTQREREREREDRYKERSSEKGGENEAGREREVSLRKFSPEPETIIQG